MPAFPQQGGSNNTWGTELRTFFAPYFDLASGSFVAASVSWAAIDKTGSSIADLTTRSHLLLTDIGANIHTVIDAFIASKAQASGIASLDGSSKVVQEPASKAQASGLASLDANSLVVQMGAVHTHTSTTTGGLVDHTILTSIGTNAHTVIDAFIASKAAASGIASLNSSSKVVQDTITCGGFTPSMTPVASQIVVVNTSTQVVVPGSIIMPNASALYGKSTTGTNCVLVAVDTGNNMVLGDSTRAVGGYCSILSGTSKDALNFYTQTQGPYIVHHAGNIPIFGAYLQTNQTVTSGITTLVTMATTEFDSHGYYDTTNKRFTPLIPGYYRFSVQSIAAGSAFTAACYIIVAKNGATVKAFYGAAVGGAATTYITFGGSALFFMNGSTDYVDIRVIITGTGTLTVNQGSSTTFWSAFRVT